MEVIHAPGIRKGTACLFPSRKNSIHSRFGPDTGGPYYADRTSNIEKTIYALERLKEIKAGHILPPTGRDL